MGGAGAKDGTHVELHQQALARLLDDARHACLVQHPLLPAGAAVALARDAAVQEQDLPAERQLDPVVEQAVEDRAGRGAQGELGRRDGRRRVNDEQ